ncbi:hypothetical protein ElyMa_006024100 [Elysia marginata]|uniref:Uncharacterized protein n=1 Tax=Elysia marginata TaxID=1093978 RepID=A0AAV4GJ14_9GAST|nr:hypothetical protein ElyMa_006024100 [Elysia marginata]
MKSGRLELAMLCCKSSHKKIQCLQVDLIVDDELAGAEHVCFECGRQVVDKQDCEESQYTEIVMCDVCNRMASSGKSSVPKQFRFSAEADINLLRDLVGLNPFGFQNGKGWCQVYDNLREANFFPPHTSASPRTVRIVEEFNEKEQLLESLIQLKEEAEWTSFSKSSKKLDEAEAKLIWDQAMNALIVPEEREEESHGELEEAPRVQEHVATPNAKRKIKASEAGDAEILQFLERREARKMEMREKELELRREELRQQREKDESERKERDALLKAIMALSQK